MADILILDLSNAQAQHLTELIKSGRFVDILDRNDRGFFGVWSIPKKPTIEAGPWLLKGPTCEIQARVINAPVGGEKPTLAELLKDVKPPNPISRVFEDDNQRGRIGRVAREHYDKIKPLTCPQCLIVFAKSEIHFCKEMGGRKAIISGNNIHFETVPGLEIWP